MVGVKSVAVEEIGMNIRPLLLTVELRFSEDLAPLIKPAIVDIAYVRMNNVVFIVNPGKFVKSVEVGRKQKIEIAAMSRAQSTVGMVRVLLAQRKLIVMLPLMVCANPNASVIKIVLINHW